MYDGVLEHKEGVLFYSPSCNRKKFGFKNKKELQNKAHTCKTNVHKSNNFKKTSSSEKKGSQLFDSAVCEEGKVSKQH